MVCLISLCNNQQNQIPTPKIDIAILPAVELHSTVAVIKLTLALQAFAIIAQALFAEFVAAEKTIPS